MSATLDYRGRIRAAYETLSPTYLRVADYILSNYFDVVFMTAAQLAHTVDADTTTVVRFAQRLGYGGYPALLQELRAAVKAEIYGAYTPTADEDGADVGRFRARVREDQYGLVRLLVHNPAEHAARAELLLAAAERVLLIGEGFGHALASVAALQLCGCGLPAWAAPADPTHLAGVLPGLEAGTLVVGVATSAWGREAARALEYARARGLSTLGVASSLSSPLNLSADLVIYAPAAERGPLPGMVALSSALAALVALAPRRECSPANAAPDPAAQVYEFLTQAELAAPEEEA